MRECETKYLSFLICDHRQSDGTIKVYIEGLPIGVITKEIKFVADRLIQKRNPFKSLLDLRRYLHDIIDLISDDI